MSPVQEFEHTGRVWFRQALSDAAVEAFDQLSDPQGGAGRRIAPTESMLAICGLESELGQLARRVLPGARAVRLVSFHKSSNLNWSVPWHQDRVIAVREKVEAPGFSNWVRKSGFWHVEPPVEYLERMMFVRVHLDATDQKNGCLELALGSHHHGRVAAADASEIAERCDRAPCTAKRGDVVFIKALMLHRSGPSQGGERRRTLRIDFSADDLPCPMAWAYAENSLST